MTQQENQTMLTMREVYYKHIRRVLRQQGHPTLPQARRRLKNVDYQINKKAALRRRWTEVAEDGQIATIRSGMDCDCTQYYHVYHGPVPVSVVAWLRDEDEHREWLDGPESCSFGKPSEHPKEHRSSDRALEAYENGHPSRVTWARYDEMQHR